MLPHPEALLASALRTETPSPERNAKIFWLATKRTRELIRSGRLNLAGILIDEMRDGARQLTSRATQADPIGRRLLAAANDLDLQLARAVR